MGKIRNCASEILGHILERHIQEGSSKIPVSVEYTAKILNVANENIIKISMMYLSDAGLIKDVQKVNGGWVVSLTAKGIDFIDG